MAVIADPSIMVDPGIEGVTTMKRGALRTSATRFMRTRMGRVGNLWANWGLRGVGTSAKHGLLASIGVSAGEGGYKFLKGASWRGVGALGLGIGIGGAVYGATGNPLFGIGAGIGSTLAIKGGLKAAGATGMSLLAPAFVLGGIYSGYQEGGLWGAAKGGVGSALEFAAYDVGFKALSIAFKGSALGKIGTFAKTAALPLGIAAGIGYGAYKGAQYFSERGRRSTEAEFTGSMDAFNTQAAYTMRQRALQEINRSHTNARTILGQEAALMHY